MVKPLTSRPEGEPRVAWRPGVETRLHTRGSTALCVIEQWCAPGAGAPTHTHFEVEEVIAVLDGAADFWVDGEMERVEAGGAIVLPPESWHGFRNAGAGELHTLALFAAAQPPVAYESEPGRVLVIGATETRMLDAHRGYRNETSNDDEGASG